MKTTVGTFVHSHLLVYNFKSYKLYILYSGHSLVWIDNLNFYTMFWNFLLFPLINALIAVSFFSLKLISQRITFCLLYSFGVYGSKRYIFLNSRTRSSWNMQNALSFFRIYTLPPPTPYTRLWCCFAPTSEHHLSSSTDLTR